MTAKRETLPAPKGREARLEKRDDRTFEVGMRPPDAGWFWLPLKTKTWPAARNQAPRALRTLLRNRADYLRTEAARLTALAVELEGFAEGLGDRQARGRADGGGAV